MQRLLLVDRDSRPVAFVANRGLSCHGTYFHCDYPQSMNKQSVVVHWPEPAQGEYLHCCESDEKVKRSDESGTHRSIMVSSAAALLLELISRRRRNGRSLSDHSNFY